MPSSLINRLRERINSRKVTEYEFGRAEVSPPATVAVVAEAESRLGFPLPSLLRDVYTLVGNGGFGPAYGLIGLPGGYTDDGYSIVELYLEFRKYYGAAWPERLIPINTRGCNIFICADCSQPHTPLIEWHAIASADDLIAWKKCFYPAADSLESWLEDWLKKSSTETNSVQPQPLNPDAPSETN
jgi:hypothetical protein